MLPIVEETGQDFGPPKEKKARLGPHQQALGATKGKKSLTVLGEKKA